VSHGPQRSADQTTALQISNINLIWEVGRSLRLLGRHAVENAGAWGDAVVVARLFGKEMQLTYLAHGGMFEEAVNERPLVGPIESRHTLPLESLAGPDQELLLGTRLVVTDLFNAFGSPEVQQIDESGRLRIRYLPGGKEFLEFAAGCEVKVSEERVANQ
jgi:hypothetical protein